MGDFSRSESRSGARAGCSDSELLELSAAAVRDGAQVFPQVAARPFGLLIGHQTKTHPFSGRPTFESLRELAFDARIARLREPEVKRRILAERLAAPSLLGALYGKTFPMGDPAEYEPPYEASLEALAKGSGRDVEDVLYDRLLEKDGRELLLVPVLNCSELSCDPIREMLLHPRAALGLGDGGAHCGILCDASIPTFMLTHWARDRKRGPTLPLELVVKRMTRDTADLYGLGDRGSYPPRRALRAARAWLRGDGRRGGGRVRARRSDGRASRATDPRRLSESVTVWCRLASR